MENYKKKICFVVAVDMTLKFILLSELRFFKDKGYAVFAVCSPGKWIESIKGEGIMVREITIKRKAFTPFSDLISLFKLFFYFKKEKFDVVFTFTPKPGLLGQLAAKMARVPVVLNTIFGFYFHEGTPYLKRRFFIFIEKIAAQCSDFIFFRNKEDFETAKKENIIKDTKAEYIGDGIDIVKFNTIRFSEEFIKEKKKNLGINLGVPVIGIVARLVKEKGYLELFEAFKSVIIKFPNSVLLIVGPSDLQKKDSINPNIVKNFGIEKNVIFLGERTDVDELYPLMDIFVLPSYREGFPHSVMEASAMARPVITTNVRGCREAIEPELTGILIPPKDYQKLAEAIIYLISNLDKANQMGMLGRKKAEKEFDKNILLGKMDKKTKELINKKL
ncbi:MAG: glycosyltransferase family 4 protein [Patescibacteria group bacterium]